jgi:Mg-chelatase subunit ChlD
MSQLYGGETLLGARSRPGQKHRFFASASGDLVIQGRTSDRAAGPRAEVALFPLSPNSGVAVLRVLLPDASRTPMPTIDRAILIVDTSSSVTTAGREAAAKLIDGLLTGLGGNTRIETLLYERESQAVLGGFHNATREARSKVLQSVRSATGGNGSNLESALSQARKLLDSDPTADMRKTLIVILSDGMIPTMLTGDAAADVLGNDVLENASLLTAVLVPPNAPLPDVHQSALGEMMLRGRGRIVALRHAEATVASASLLSELSQPLPLGTLEVELSSGDWVGADLEGQLLPGSSITALGFYQGKAPKKVTVRGLRGGVPETLVASKLRANQARALAAIAVANASPFGMPGANTSAEQSQESLRQAAAKLGVVTQMSAAIAVSTTDGYAADRIRMAQKWGMQTYLRVAPPAERDAVKKSFKSFQLRPRRKAVNRGRTGYIDEKMIARRVKAHVIPVARRCYEKLLRKNQSAAGAISLHIEMSRGEVLHAGIPFLPPSLEPIRRCIEDAMYAMPVPIVRQGQAAEIVSVANYPLRFRMAKKGSKGAVESAKPGDANDTDNPLLGLPE